MSPRGKKASWSSTFGKKSASRKQARRRNSTGKTLKKSEESWQKKRVSFAERKMICVGRRRDTSRKEAGSLKMFTFIPNRYARSWRRARYESRTALLVVVRSSKKMRGKDLKHGFKQAGTPVERICLRLAKTITVGWLREPLCEKWHWSHQNDDWKWVEMATINQILDQDTGTVLVIEEMGH